VYKVEDSVLNGSGAGRPLGLLNSGATITVAAEAGQSAGTFVIANARTMLARSWVGSRRNLAWFVHPDLEADLGSLQLENGGPAFVYGADGEARLLGKPVIATEYNAQRGARGDVILADLSQFLLAEHEADVLSSIHVNFNRDETCFKFRWRLDGQPAWASPITPANGTLTQSPFVTLAARP
jgi:HK97 family phage major capsid protein